ncbi:MAG: hypothetical protein ACI4AL_12075 [Aristaeellaceae bacterium]
MNLFARFSPRREWGENLAFGNEVTLKRTEEIQSIAAGLDFVYIRKQRIEKNRRTSDP